MDAREELKELLNQAREHLLYYRDLGLTHIGEHSAPAVMLGPEEEQANSAPEPSQPSEITALPAMAKPKQLEPPAAIVFTPPQFLSKQEITMANTKETPVVASLFERPATSQPKTPPEIPQASETLEDIRRDLGECQRCKLWTTRTKIVFGEGSPQAQLMFVGEAPGADEDASGRPFVGRAGQLLTKMIEAIELKREDVYIANILKSRPPGNRNPEAEETRACIPFLYRQIATIRPRLIVTLGNPATQGLLGVKTGISQLRGQFQDFPRDTGIKILPTFHPAYLLRSPDKKREAWDDLKKVRAFLRGEIES